MHLTIIISDLVILSVVELRFHLCHWSSAHYACMYHTIEKWWWGVCATIQWKSDGMAIWEYRIRFCIPFTASCDWKWRLFFITEWLLNWPINALQIPLDIFPYLCHIHFVDRKEPPRLDITYAYGVEKLTPEEKEARLLINLWFILICAVFCFSALLNMPLHTSGLSPVQTAANGRIQKTWEAETCWC